MKALPHPLSWWLYSTVLEFMDKGCAICAKADNKIVGTLLFSKESVTLCFLAVDAEYRRQNIAEKMFTYMLIFMDAEKVLPLRHIVPRS